MFVTNQNPAITSAMWTTILRDQNPYVRAKPLVWKRVSKLFQRKEAPDGTRNKQNRQKTDADFRVSSKETACQRKGGYRSLSPLYHPPNRAGGRRHPADRDYDRYRLCPHREQRQDRKARIICRGSASPCG